MLARILALALAIFPALAFAQSSPLPGFPPGVFQNRAAIDGGGGAPPAFQGPLDIAPGAVAAFCLRACSAANIGGNVVTIQRASDSTSQTFISLPNGALDVASITTFLSGTTGKVTQWWDQSGHGNHATATTNGPAFTLNVSGLGTGKCGITFDGATAGQNLAVGPVAAPQAFFISAVSVRTSGTSFVGIYSQDSGGDPPGLLYANSANSVLVFAGNTSSTAVVSDGSFHAIGALFNGASSQAFVDGTGGGAINAGTAGLAGTGAPSSIGNFSGTPLAGSISEILLYASDVSADAAALSTNQHGGYSF